MKNVFLRTSLIICFAAMFFTSCENGKMETDKDDHRGSTKNPDKQWELVPNPQHNNAKLDCGEESVIYTNNTNKEEDVRVDFTNNCEFTAWCWVERDSIMQPGTQFAIPGRGKVKTHLVLNPGDRIVGLCSMVSTVANEGCKVEYWVFATR